MSNDGLYKYLLIGAIIFFIAKMLSTYISDSYDKQVVQQAQMLKSCSESGGNFSFDKNGNPSCQHNQGTLHND